MAKIGLYRVEHKDHRAGPYGSMPVQSLLHHGVDGDEFHPTAQNDGIGYLSQLPMTNPYFAFKSLKKLSQWFSTDELNELRKYGFNPVRIWVDRNNVLEGNKQVVFEREN